MSDARETAATIFDRTAKLANGLASAMPDPAGAALRTAAAISGVVAGLIRTLGVDGTHEAIADLAARKNEGAIRDVDIAQDDREIDDAIGAMYADDEGAKE